MILPFSTQIDGKPTYFVDKIWHGLTINKLVSRPVYMEYYNSFHDKYKNGLGWEIPDLANAKITTIREDIHDRWKVGNKIHFTINNRTKNSFQFAPILTVKSIQNILIKYTKSSRNSHPLVYIEIDGRCFSTYNIYTKMYYGNLDFLIANDGFNSVSAFFSFFNSDFKGKIIHWTNFKY